MKISQELFFAKKLTARLDEQAKRYYTEVEILLLHSHYCSAIREGIISTIAVLDSLIAKAHYLNRNILASFSARFCKKMTEGTPILSMPSPAP